MHYSIIYIIFADELYLFSYMFFNHFRSNKKNKKVVKINIHYVSFREYII